MTAGIGIGMVGSGFMSLTYAYGIARLVPETRLVAILGGGDRRMVRHTYARVIGAYAPAGHWILV